MVDHRLRELLDRLGRCGVCLKVGARHPNPDGPWATVEVVLTRMITQRSLSPEAVDDALKLLSVAEFELKEVTRELLRQR